MRTVHPKLKSDLAIADANTSDGDFKALGQLKLPRDVELVPFHAN